MDAIDQRNFQCSCGRKYLSYSALYTHSKQKHGITISTRNIQSLYSRNEDYSHKKTLPEESSKKGLYIDLEKAQGIASYYSTNNKLNNGGNHQYVQITEKPVTIQKALIEFMSSEDTFFNENEKNSVNGVLASLVAYINHNHSLIDNYTSSSKYCENRTSAFLPLLLNSFYHE